MRAFVFKRVGEVGVTEKPVPAPGPDEALVRTTAAMVCTSDVHNVNGAIPIAPGVTLGHEAVGLVHALGVEVNGLQVGHGSR
ncbi:alcohol dehydrogenase catalytic domain-containing protein [Kitasatospora sp. NPDC056138]|uniref:alcohol dehydrogenase catalytic domain-containing protein n=1 Tax=Kitasatospora sp. NPDC056138 TaxID=3345724 RepID=UPI0035D6BFFF